MVKFWIVAVSQEVCCYYNNNISATAELRNMRKLYQITGSYHPLYSVLVRLPLERLLGPIFQEVYRETGEGLGRATKMPRAQVL